MEEEIILNQIIEEAQSEANLVISEAQEAAKKIEEENLSKATKEAQEQFEIIKAKETRNSISELEKAEFEARSAELVERKRIIEIVKEKVKQKIKDLDDDSYVKIIDEKISRHKEEKGIEVILPKKCYEKIKKIAVSYGMQVLEETDEFESGVIIKIGKIEYNYDFEENMKFMDEEIEKEIDTILFS